MVNEALEHNLTTIINTPSTYIGLQVTMATILRFDDSLKGTYSYNETNYSNMHALVGDSPPTSHMAAADEKNTMRLICQRSVKLTQITSFTLEIHGKCENSSAKENHVGLVKQKLFLLLLLDVNLPGFSFGEVQELWGCSAQHFRLAKYIQHFQPPAPE